MNTTHMSHAFAHTYEIKYRYRLRHRPKRSAEELSELVEADILEEALFKFKAKQHYTRNGWVMRPERIFIYAITQKDTYAEENKS